MKRSVFAGGWGVAGALLFAGCGGPAADVEVRVRTITAEDVDRIEPGRKLTIDTTDVRAGFVFDQREHAIDFERVNLICPNGAMMPMDRWLDAQGAAQGADLKNAIYNAVGQIETPAAATADPDTNDDDCEERCWRCEDGLVLCHYSCELQSLRRMAENGGWMLDPRIVAGLQGPPGPTSPGGGDPGGGDGGGAPPTGDPNDGGRPGGEGSGGTDGGGGGGGSGGSSGTGGTPGGQGSAGGNQGGSSGTGGGRGFF